MVGTWSVDVERPKSSQIIHFAAILCSLILANKLNSFWNFQKLISVNYRRLIGRVDRALGRAGGRRAVESSPTRPVISMALVEIDKFVN